GVLDDTFPISEKFHFRDGHVDFSRVKAVKKNVAGVDVSTFDTHLKEVPKRNSKGKIYVKFELPQGSLSDEEIKSQSTDEFHALWLIMKRDLQVVVDCHIEEIKDLIQKKVQNGLGGSSSNIPEPSQSEMEMLSNPSIQKYLDEMVCIAKLVKDLPKGWDDVSNPSSSFFVKPTFNEENCWKAFQYALGNGPSKCSLRLDDYHWDEDFLYVFIPVLIRDGSSGHFVLYVVDLNKHIIYYLDNKVFVNVACYKEKIKRISSILVSNFIADQLSSLFENLNLVFDIDIGLFPTKEVKGDWKKGATDLDCAVYVMVHMLFFDGSEHFNFEPLNDVNFFLLICWYIVFYIIVFIITMSLYALQEKRRKVCRSCICGSLVLFDMNKVRPEILDKVISFRDKRLSALEEIYVNRSKREEAQKIEEEKRRKALEDLKGKEAQSFAKEGGEQQGEDGKNPRRSTRGKTKK
ncbi:Selenoprotein S, partial [Bienertia sinuspersici]